MNPQAFGLLLSRLFDRAYRTGRGPKDRELFYFRCLIEAFSGMAEAFAAELHGRSSLVEFRPTGPWTGRCELADVALVSYRTGPRPEVRLSLIQAKFERTPLNPLLLHAPPHQWDLLHHRLPLTAVIGHRVQGMPLDLLPSAVLPSIASYLFFCHANRQAALYGPADTFPRGPNGPRGGHALLTREIAGTVRAAAGSPHQEVLRTDTIAEFGAAVRGMLVGSPFLSATATTNTAASFWLLNVLRRLQAERPHDRLQEIIALFEENADRLSAGKKRRDGHRGNDGAGANVDAAKGIPFRAVILVRGFDSKEEAPSRRRGQRR